MSKLTPITAKIQKTTKGGVVQPVLNVGKVDSPAKWVGGSYNLGYSKPTKEESKKEKKSFNIYDYAASKGAYDGAKAATSSSNNGKLNTGSKEGNLKLKDVLERKGLDVSGYKGDTRPKMEKGTYRYAKAANADLDNIISKRNKATKGSAEYNRYQNQINKAYGVGPTNRSTTEKSVSATKTPKVSIETKQPTASTEIKPQTKKSTVKVDPKKAAKVENISRRADKTRAKGEAALAAGDVKKAQRLRKRYDRQEARASRQADKAIEPKVNKKELRQTKRKLVKEQRAKFKASKKEIKNYKDY